jgi:hypothetical protein
LKINKDIRVFDDIALNNKKEYNINLEDIKKADKKL